MKAKRVTVIVVLIIVMIFMATGITSAKAKAPAKNAQPVNVNVAPLTNLQTLPEIGEKTAQAIIDGRPYKTAKDLLNVKGIGEAKLKKIQDRIEVKLNINFATLDELKALPGITPKLAQPIVDGRPYKTVKDLLNVKGIGEKTLAKIQDLITTKININSATPKQLQTLSGVGPDLAKAIVAGRPYKKVNDLLRVKGMGEKKLAAIKDQVAVQY